LIRTGSRAVLESFTRRFPRSGIFSSVGTCFRSRFFGIPRASRAGARAQLTAPTCARWRDARVRRRSACTEARHLFSLPADEGTRSEGGVFVSRERLPGGGAPRLARRRIRSRGASRARLARPPATMGAGPKASKAPTRAKVRRERHEGAVEGGGRRGVRGGGTHALFFAPSAPNDAHARPQPTRTTQASAGKDRARAPAKERAQRAKDAKHKVRRAPRTRPEAASRPEPRRVPESAPLPGKSRPPRRTSRRIVHTASAAFISPRRFHRFGPSRPVRPTNADDARPEPTPPRRVFPPPPRPSPLPFAKAQAPNPPSTRARAVSFANPPPPDATTDAPPNADQHRRSRAPAARPPPPFVAPYPPSSTRQMRSSSGPGQGPPGPPGPAIATHPGRTAPGGPPAAAKAAAPRGGAARAGGISPQHVGAAAATRAIEHLAGARGSLSSSLSELTDHHHHHAAGVAAPPVLFSGPGGGPGMSAPPGSHAHVQMSPGGGYVLGPGARWNFAHAGFLVDVEERVGSKDSPNAGESADGPPARANEATKAAETETPSPPEDGRRFDDATLGSGDGSDKGSADPTGSDKGSADPSGSGPHGVGGGPAPSPARPRSGARGVGYLVHTMSSAAPARRPSLRCGETRAVFGEHAHRLVREMMLRQQNEFELQLIELHRVLETQRQLTKEPSPPKSGSVGGGKEGPPRVRRDGDERRREGPRYGGVSPRVARVARVGGDATEGERRRRCLSGSRRRRVGAQVQVPALERGGGDGDEPGAFGRGVWRRRERRRERRRGLGLGRGLGRVPRRLRRRLGRRGERPRARRRRE
jgi:hypothetical protein